eukprot:GEMP01046473.1.p1 GENE.GEMP01046473.1~~GEMP01046473.1.p1  ORF type:complete len:115 (+),score=10.49 GEMP01046473.1:243-587(+)
MDQPNSASGSPSLKTFSHKELAVLNICYDFDIHQKADHVSRMDVLHRVCVSFLFLASASRSKDIIRFFFANAMVVIYSRVRLSFPPGKAAPCAGPFIKAVKDLRPGVSCVVLWN